MLAWTSVIEGSSYTRKDGRALRLLLSDEKPNVKELLKFQCTEMLSDLKELKEKKFGAGKIYTKVVAGDARRIPFADGSFTAVCYSPPYLKGDFQVSPEYYFSKIIHMRWVT
jgi:hypothetical protein